MAFFVLRTNLLKASQRLGTSLATSYAGEQHRNLTVYETLLTFGLESVVLQSEQQTPMEQIRNWMERYFQRVQETVGKEKVDPHAVIDGEVITAYPWIPAEGYDYSQAEWYKKAVAAGGDVVYTDVYIDALYHRPIITLSQYDQDSNTVFAFDIYPENIPFPEVELPEQSALFLCDSKGTLIYSQMADGYSDAEIQTYVHGLLQDIQKGKHERYDSSVLDLDGCRRGVYYSELPGEWVVVVTIPFSDILGNLQQLTAGGILVLVGLICIFALFTWRDIHTGRNMRRTNETVRVIANSYYALYRVDYNRETYEMIKGSEEVRSSLGQTGDYADLLKIIGDLIDPDIKEEYLKSFSLANIRDLVSRRVRNFGGDFLRRYGDIYRWVNVRVLYDDVLAPGEVVLCFWDIDQEKQQQLKEQQLLETSLDASQQSEKSKQIFFSSMSHDMRTPLNAIIGLSELAAQSVNDPQKTAAYLEKIDRSSKLLLELINEILDMSHIEQGKMLLNNQQFDLKRCIEECADIFQVQADKEKKRFTCTTQIKTVQVMGDPFRINQILNNLLSNAFKFTGEGDSIRLAVSQIESREFVKIAFRVEDTGIGMSEEFLSKVYEPYSRENRFGTHRVAGTGLGMAIVKNLVEQMNGQISVESRQGRGTAFTITLPFLAAEEQIPQAEPEETDFTLQGKRLLLAEDNVVNMEVATEILSMNGIEVVGAWNGREAVAAFQASEPFAFDAILMDMQMPEVDGCAAARQIRRLLRPDAKTIPIIAVTANAFAEDIALTSAAGMNAHISKPIDFQALYATLKKLLEKHTQ